MSRRLISTLSRALPGPARASCSSPFRSAAAFSSTATRCDGWVPQVIESDSRGEKRYDLFSRLLKERVMYVGDVTEFGAGLIVNQLLYLEASDPEKEISMYINSRGGDYYSIMSVYDTMQFVKCPIHTVCLGHASSLASLLLAGGSKGHRSILPSASVMMHQPYGGARGQQSDIAIAAKETLRQRETLENLYLAHCQLPNESTEETKKRFRTALERDYFLNPTGALDFGIVDKIQEPRGKSTTPSSGDD